jgi:hypothetical protein
MKNKKIAAFSVSAAFAFGVIAPAQASTFADYDASSTAANLSWTETAGVGVLSTQAGTLTSFSFLTPALSGIESVPALFTLSAVSSAPAQSVLGLTVEPGLSGGFSFTYAGANPLHVGSQTFLTGANLLSGTFAGAEIEGQTGGSTASVQDEIITGGTVSYASAFTDFAPTGDKALSIELTSVSKFTVSNGELDSFNGVSTGSFASDVPEPAAWAMMLVGFGGMGATMRARRKRALAAV